MPCQRAWNTVNTACAIGMRQALSQLRGSGLRRRYGGNGGSSREACDEREKCAGCGGRESR